MVFSTTIMNAAKLILTQEKKQKIQRVNGDKLINLFSNLILNFSDF